MKKISAVVSVLFITFTMACAHKQASKTGAMDSPATTKAEAPVDPALDKILQQYSYEQLHAVAGYSSYFIIQDVSARAAKKKMSPVLKCDPDTKSLQSMEKFNVEMMQIKGLIDIKAPQETSRYTAQTVSQRVKDGKYATCLADCMCGAYADLLENIEPEKLKPEDLALIDKMKKQHLNLTDAQEKKCALKAAWYCESDLQKYLQSLH